MSLDAEWKPYGKYLEWESLEQTLKTIEEFHDTRIVHVLPSLIASAEGEVLSTIFFTTESGLLGEVAARDPLQWDVINAQLVVNVRVALASHKRELDGESVDFETATVVLAHAAGPEDMSSDLHFVGESRAEWLSHLKEMLPSATCPPGKL